MLIGSLLLLKPRHRLLLRILRLGNWVSSLKYELSYRIKSHIQSIEAKKGNEDQKILSKILFDNVIQYLKQSLYNSSKAWEEIKLNENSKILFSVV
jgi:hypothetical protein